MCGLAFSTANNLSEESWDSILEKKWYTQDFSNFEWFGTKMRIVFAC